MLYMLLSVTLVNMILTKVESELVCSKSRGRAFLNTSSEPERDVRRQKIVIDDLDERPRVRHLHKGAAHIRQERRNGFDRSVSGHRIVRQRTTRWSNHSSHHKRAIPLKRAITLSHITISIHDSLQ